MGSSELGQVGWGGLSSSHCAGGGGGGDEDESALVS